MGKPHKGQSIELPVTTLAFGGQGIGRMDDFVVFVAGAVPGDVVRARVTRVKKRYAEARLELILTPSADRVDPHCRHFESCGGCRWQSLDYRVQLRYKQQQVRDTLERLGGLDDFDLQPIEAMDHPWRYRNKVEFSIGAVGGRPTIGFHPPGRWDTVLSMDECHLVPETTEGVRTTVEEWLRARGLAPWNPRENSGFARHLAVREAAATGEVLVNLVTAPGTLPDGEGLVRVLRERHPQIVGVLHAVNESPAEVATGLPHTILWGRPYLYENLDGLRLKVSIDAFFQTNTRMAAVLYETAAREAALTGNEVVWDLYSGIGSIALYLARRARTLLGIEIVAAAVRDAQENAALNNLTSATFLEGDARKVLKEILEGHRVLPEGLARPDVVVLDPPRGGLANKVIARVAAASPAKVVYVSCNPSTMAPNASLFRELGYRLARVTPVDMFPHTPHIEAVGLLERIAAGEPPEPRLLVRRPPSGPPGPDPVGVGGQEGQADEGQSRKSGPPEQSQGNGEHERGRHGQEPHPGS